jgi:hypothetical protein
MAKQGMDTYHEASSSKGNGGSKKLESLVVKPTKNKGHVIEHHFDNSDSGVFIHRPEVHAFGEAPEAVAHLMKHMGVKENEMIAHLQSGHEGEDTEAPGGGGKESSNDEGTKKKEKGRSKAEERGED